MAGQTQQVSTAENFALRSDPGNANIATEYPKPRFAKRLGVITHVPHWFGPEGTLWAYEPYVRELRIWADLFEQVIVLAPRGEAPQKGQAEGNQAPYCRANVIWRPFNYSLSYGRWAPLTRLTQVPALCMYLLRLIRDCDLIHLRSPGHPALLGHILVRLLRKRSITKWAGLFAKFSGERLPRKVERLLVHVQPSLHPVLIYGPSVHENMISFLPALMSEEELASAHNLSCNKSWDQPWRLLSVGRLIEVKNFHTAIRGLGALRRTRPDLRWEFTLVGDGPDAELLRALTLEYAIVDRVQFTGALPFAEVQRRYAETHLVIMPGEQEGWPKVIAEAWAHSAIPVAAAAGIVPWILQSGEFGLLFRPSADGLAETLSELMDDEIRLKGLIARCAGRSRYLSLERFKERLEEILVTRCGLN
jgi:glycosyltransferase involved in cell wall biosynthesis